MAIQRIAYSCDFKCGTKVVLSKKAMESHESRCFHNPEKKACITCIFFSSYNDSNGQEGTPYHNAWTVNVCNIDEIELEKLKNNCLKHKSK